ncbi:MAG: hypothetical protein K0M73_16780 [Hydrogenophaga sp.]|uniref:Transmembrane protein n=1 Tax=Hydrogenophaga aromaticivorans TaxID=2610898 RepID=A0A7Y8H2Y6_9BURK|nr:BPSS1780 family membrane protein [Hydrogenophaga aromaticivorans]MBW8316516.1 hypothetical protein [Hydrogenophaga sp.]NWF48722.1 hypothetical protein [Hydrogenophaga aromaticivorans]
MKLRNVPAGTGLQWVKLGIQTFFRQPLALSGLFFMFMAAVSVLSIIPILGTALSAVLTPAANLGLMAASREASAGRFPMPSTLVSAFRGSREQKRAMLVLGSIYAGCLLLVLATAALLGPAAPVGEVETSVTPQMMQDLLGSPGLWFALLVYIPVLMMFWHAPALVHWHGVSPVKSLFFSALACWQNKGALLVFAIGWMGVFLLSGLVISFLGSVLGGAQALNIIMYPAVLFVASMFYASVYFTFRDSFDTGAEPEQLPSTTGDPT